MPNAEYNKEKCAQRSRVAAMRYGTEAVPLRFVGTSIKDIENNFAVLDTAGSLPKDEADCIRLINQGLPPGATPVDEKNVYIHFYEAANSNFVPSYFLHLGESTLKNIANSAAHGVSFMNSHATGGLSAPPELPFGQTFAGQFQSVLLDNRFMHRAIVAVYMLSGIAPNGSNGPTTDDLDQMIRGGGLRDVSVGLLGGYKTCDVCANRIGYNDPGAYEDIKGKDGRTRTVRKCQHSPGTIYRMNKEEIEAQKNADPGNKTGAASYTVHDARFGELSAVYDGAVPGAGVQQVFGNISDYRDNLANVTPDEFRLMLQQAYATYGRLLPFDLSEVVSIKPRRNTLNARGTGKGANKMSLLDLIKGGWTPPADMDLSQLGDNADNNTPPVVVLQQGAQNAELTKLQQQLQERETELTQLREQARTQRATDLRNGEDDFIKSTQKFSVPAGEAQLRAVYRSMCNLDAGGEAVKMEVKLSDGTISEVTASSHIQLMRNFLEACGERGQFAPVPTDNTDPRRAEFSNSQEYQKDLTETEQLTAQAKSDVAAHIKATGC